MKRARDSRSPAADWRTGQAPCADVTVRPRGERHRGRHPTSDRRPPPERWRLPHRASAMSEVADRLSMLVVGATADQSLFDLEFGDALAVEMIDNLLEFGHNFGADAVARKEQELESRHVPSRDARGKRGGVLDDFRLARKPDLGAIRRGRTLAVRATRFQMESQPAILSFPRTRESEVSAEAWLNARFRGRDGGALRATP